MYGKYFTYNGHSSEEFGLIIGGTDSLSDIPFAMSRQTQVGTLGKYRNKVNSMGTIWDSVLSFSIPLMKDPCIYTVQEDMFFTEDEIAEINAWLTSPNYPILFHMYDVVTNDSQTEVTLGKTYDYFGVVTDVVAESVSERAMYLVISFETNSPFAWTYEITQTFSVTGGEGNYTFTVNNNDRFGYIYPVITITPTSSPGDGKATITIVNERDGLPMQITVPVEPITIDCEKSMISDAAGVLTFEDLGIGAEDYIYWPKLYHGQNTISVTGDCDVTISYREPRKVGAY